MMMPGSQLVPLSTEYSKASCSWLPEIRTPLDQVNTGLVTEDRSNGALMAIWIWGAYWLGISEPVLSTVCRARESEAANKQLFDIQESPVTGTPLIVWFGLFCRISGSRVAPVVVLTIHQFK